MKHRYPRYLRERYQQKKIDKVIAKLDGKSSWTNYSFRFDNSIIDEIIAQNQAKINLMMEMMTGCFNPMKIGSNKKMRIPS